MAQKTTQTVVTECQKVAITMFSETYPNAHQYAKFFQNDTQQ